jgi:hypothetical protein
MRSMRALLLALALAGQAPAQDTVAGSSGTLTLEVRVFNGSEEVTAHTRLTVHRAGDRADPVAQVTPATGRAELKIAPASTTFRPSTSARPRAQHLLGQPARPDAVSR